MSKDAGSVSPPNSPDLTAKAGRIVFKDSAARFLLTFGTLLYKVQAAIFFLPAFGAWYFAIVAF